MLVHLCRALAEPVAGIAQVVVVDRPPGVAVDRIVVMVPFVCNHLIHRVPYGAHAFLVEEVTHVDAGAIDELAAEVGIFHDVAE